MTLVTSDGGLSEDYPDDTVAALEAAVVAGADRIELDVRCTRDGELVVHHPAYLGSRLTAPLYPSSRHDIEPVPTAVADLTLAELHLYDAGSWAGETHAGMRVPTLDEAFDACGILGLELDLKIPNRGFLAAVAGWVQHRDLVGRVEFTATEHFALAEIHRLLPGAEIGTFHDDRPAGLDERLWQDLVFGELQVGAVRVMHAVVGLLDASFVARLHDAGYLVHATGCESDDELTRAFDLGVDRLSTRHLRRALALRPG